MSVNPVFTRSISRSRLSDEIVTIIQQQIMSGAIAPGTRLPTALCTVSLTLAAISLAESSIDVACFSAEAFTTRYQTALRSSTAEQFQDAVRSAV